MNIQPKKKLYIYIYIYICICILNKDLFITFIIVSKIGVIVIKLKDWLDDAMYWQSKGVQQIFLENYLFYGGVGKAQFFEIFFLKLFKDPFRLIGFYPKKDT